MAETRLTKKDAAALAREREQRKAANAQQRWITAQKLGGLLVTHVPKWGTIGFIALQCRYCIEALAGKSTLATFIAALGVNASIGVAASWSVTVGFAVWVFFERRLRKGTAERLSLRVQELELKLDRRRSSSDLSPKGDTRPEDEV